MSSWRRCVAAVLVAGTVLACGYRPGAEREQPPAPAWTIGDRHSALAAPGEPRGYDLEFADANTGYVLFTQCRRPCPATLYGTIDGGRTWTALPLDVPRGADAWLTVVDASRLAIRIPEGYSVSRDGGRTFGTEKEYPADFSSTYRQPRRECVKTDDDGACERYEVGDVKRQPPVPEDLEVDEVAADATGRVWTVTTHRGVIHTAVTADGGATWQTLPEVRPGGTIDRLAMTAAPGDGGPWLVVGAENTLFAYRGAADRWRPVVEGRPFEFDWSRARSAGGGAIALYDTTVGVLTDDGTWRVAVQPDRLFTVSRLDDGSLLGSPANLQGAWLGVRTGAEFSWTFVTVAPRGS